MAGHDMMCYLPKVGSSDVDKALSGWQARYPKLGICALLPEAEKENVATLQAACARRAVPLVGGIFPELIRDGEFCRSGVWLLCFSEMPYFSLIENLPVDQAGA